MNILLQPDITTLRKKKSRIAREVWSHFNRCTRYLISPFPRYVYFTWRSCVRRESDGLTNRRKVFWRCAVWAQTRLCAKREKKRGNTFFSSRLLRGRCIKENSRDDFTDDSFSMKSGHSSLLISAYQSKHRSSFNLNDSRVHRWFHSSTDARRRKRGL